MFANFKKELKHQIVTFDITHSSTPEVAGEEACKQTREPRPLSSSIGLDVPH